MKRHYVTTLLLCFLVGTAIQAQSFLRPFETVSKKKPAYITMTNGDEIECTIDKIKRKKGLIDEIVIENAKGKKESLDLKKVAYAYFPQSGLDKLVKLDDFLKDATQWEQGLHDMDRIKDGYAVFESADVMVKKKKIQALMQLLNPGTCSKLKVFHDPWAGESASVGVGVVKVAGGLEKSYYVKKGDDAGYKLSKNDFKKADDFFNDCKAMSAYKDMKWGQFEEAIFFYNENCK